MQDINVFSCVMTGKNKMTDFCNWTPFLGAFAKCREATISFVISVCPSARSNSTSTGQIFSKFYIWVFFENFLKKFRFYSNLTTISTLREDLHTFMMISISVLLGINVFETKVEEKIKTRTLSSINFSPRKSCLLWENVGKCNTARQATDDNIMRRMNLACCFSKATDTHSEYGIHNDFRRQKWLRERASMLRLYVH